MTPLKTEDQNTQAAPKTGADKRHGRARPKSDRLGFELVNCCDFGLIVINHYRVVSVWNTWMERASGVSRHDVLGRTLEDVFPNLQNSRLTNAVESSFADNLPSVLSPKFSKRCLPLFHWTNDGKYRLDQQVTLKPVSETADETFCLIQITDVTTATKREKMLRKATRETRIQRDELAGHIRDKDKFFQIIAHDLRSPFTALLGLSSLLTHGSETLGRDKIKEYSCAVHQSASQLYKLLENLLDWSLMQRGRLEFSPIPLNPITLVEDCVNLLASTAERKRITLTVDIQPDVIFNADPRMTATILRNLVGNSLKFTPIGGRVTITVQKLEDVAEINISDTGVGITDEQIDGLLNANDNKTTKGTAGEVGSGLGFHLCRELIAQQGGTLQITSTLGVGSSIRFTLPSPPRLTTDAMSSA